MQTKTTAHEPQHVVGRLAPSPTGSLHAGNIFAALMAWLTSKSAGGDVVLRIEDLDHERSRAHFVDEIQKNYELLGLFWDRGPYFQHDRTDAYREAFECLVSQDLIYPCFCSRAQTHTLSAPHFGEKVVYPGTCRNLSEEERRARMNELCDSTTGTKLHVPSYRLMVDDKTVEIDDIFQGHYTQKLDKDCGDFIVRRSDGAFAYQLAVVVDDAEQQINEVVRGIDLLNSAPQQRYLQDLLGYDHVQYAHFPLFVGQDGRRLSKRNHDAAIDELLARYKTPAGVIGHIAYIAGIIGEEQEITPAELIDVFDLAKIGEFFRNRTSILYGDNDVSTS